MEAGINHQNQQEADGKTDAEQGLVAQKQNGCQNRFARFIRRGQTDGSGGGDQQGNAPDHVLRAQSGDEGVGELQPGQQEAVHEANQGGSQDAHGDQKHRIGDIEDLESHADHAGAEDGVVAHRQVNTAGDQADQHTGGNQTVDGCLLQQDHQVADRKEAAGKNTEERHQNGKSEKSTQFGQSVLQDILFFCFLNCVIHLNFLPMRLS